MEDHVKIRQEHVRLVRAGKHDEAQVLLEIIQGRRAPLEVSKNPINEIIVKDKTENKKGVEDKPEKKKEVEESCELDKLIRIKGVGKKTVLDIKVMFKDIKSLVVALKENRVALRDDIVKKLKEELI